MNRVVLLGCAGAGKTALSRTLSARTGIPVVCLDAIWQPAWSDADIPTFRALVAERHAGPAWISDGNFASSTFDLRLPRADLVVWLDRPRSVCFWNATRRAFRRGEAHRLRDLPGVLTFIRNFDAANRPRIEAARREHGPTVPVARLTTQREIDLFPAGFPAPRA